MSTVRIQVRRGTASEWTAANPILAAGEMGVETNTNKFKFGNGSDTWTALSYAAADTAAIGEISQDAINTALSMGSGLTKTYNDGANTITIAVDDAIIATVDYVDAAVSSVGSSLSGYLETGERGAQNGVASLDASAKILESELDLDGVSLNIATGGTISGNSISTASLVATDINSGGQINANNIVVSGNLTVEGTTTTVSSANLSITDPMIYMGDGNSANLSDLGIVSAFNDGTYQHSGIVRDASENKWKIFKGVTDEPTATVNFAQGSLDNLAVGALEASSATIGNVSNTELQYLNGVTSAVQTQIDDINADILTQTNKSITVDQELLDIHADISDVALVQITKAATVDTELLGIHSDITDINGEISNLGNTYAVKENPVFTGTITLPNASIQTADIAGSAITESLIEDNAVTTAKIADSAVTTGKIANGAIVDADINASASIAQSKIDGLEDALGAKAPLSGPTFTDSVVLPSTTSIGDVTSTEIGYLDGVTSSIQTQIGAASTALSSHESDTTNIHGIADTALLATTAYADAAEADAITAAGTAADSKVAAAVAALTKSSVGLANVDNTSDANKPVSTATQTALDLKANLAGPVFTGTTVATDLVVNGDFTVNGSNFSASATSITIEDNMIQIAHQNSANTVDLGLVVGYNDGTTKHSGLVRDVSDAKWKLFKGVTTEPSTTVDFTQGSLDDLKVGAFEATTVTPSSGVVFSDGTQTKEGVPSITTIGTAIDGAYNLSTGGLALRDQLIPVSGAHAITVPTNTTTAYPVGTSISFYQSAGADANFVEASGVTILRTPGLKLRALSSSATLTKVATDTWLLAGDLKA